MKKHFTTFQIHSISNLPFFEGWYYKLISSSGDTILSIIPGFAITKKKKEAFIQILDGIKKKSYYLSYELCDLRQYHHLIRIKNNFFTPSSISLDLHDNGIELKGTLYFTRHHLIHRTLLQPNMMGFFSYFPHMECCHDVISLNHKLLGELTYNNKKIDFNKGKGYIEKDWGTSFPKEYCWIQSHHFEASQDHMFMLSIAHIPFMNNYFIGHLGLLYIGGKEYRFSTYTGSRILTFRKNKTHLLIQLKKFQYRLHCLVTLDEGCQLKAPKSGEMIKPIEETVTGRIDIKLFKNNSCIYSDRGHYAGVEIIGSIMKYFS